MEISSGFTTGDVAKAIVTGLVLLVAWLLRKLGEQHITTLKELTMEVRELSERVSRMEGRLDKHESTDLME